MILSKEIAEKKLKRMAMEVAERNHNKESLILIGIKENGIVIAEKIASLLKDIFPGRIDIIWLSMDKKNPGEIVLSKAIQFTENKCYPGRRCRKQRAYHVLCFTTFVEGSSQAGRDTGIAGENTTNNSR
jgi:hypothetical protein